MLDIFDGGADSCHGTLVTQNLHHGVQVGGVGLAGNSLADEGGNIGYRTLKGGGVSLVGLHIGGKADGFGDLPICVAKTQYSFSDDPLKLGAPENFRVTVRNLKVSGTVSGGTNYVGGIAGYNMGKMEYVIFEGSVTGDGSYIGGVIGVNSGTLNFVSNKASVSGTNSTFGLAVGGITGINLTGATLRNCYNDGITVSSAKVNAPSVSTNSLNLSFGCLH